MGKRNWERQEFAKVHGMPRWPNPGDHCAIFSHHMPRHPSRELTSCMNCDVKLIKNELGEFVPLERVEEEVVS